MKIGEIINNHDKAIMQRYDNQFTYWNKHFNRVSCKVFRRKNGGHTYQIGTVSYKAVTLKLIGELSLIRNSPLACYLAKRSNETFVYTNRRSSYRPYSYIPYYQTVL